VQSTPARPGTPDCPMVHRTVSGAPGWTSVNSPLSGFDDDVRLKFTGLSGGAPDRSVSHPRRTRRSRETEKGDVAIIHRLSGGAPDCPVSQQSAAKSAGDAWQLQRSAGGTGPDSELQRLRVPDLKGNHAPDRLQ
jgi:hypothetical protein